MVKPRHPMYLQTPCSVTLAACNSTHRGGPCPNGIWPLVHNSHGSSWLQQACPSDSGIAQPARLGDKGHKDQHKLHNASAAVGAPPTAPELVGTAGITGLVGGGLICPARSGSSQHSGCDCHTQVQPVRLTCWSGAQPRATAQSLPVGIVCPVQLFVPDGAPSLQLLLQGLQLGNCTDEAGHVRGALSADLWDGVCITNPHVPTAECSRVLCRPRPRRARSFRSPCC